MLGQLQSQFWRLLALLKAGRPPAAEGMSGQTEQFGLRTAALAAAAADFPQAVIDYQRRRLEGAIGVMAHHAATAAGKLVELTRTAKAESLQMAAARAILLIRLPMARDVVLERRMAEIEERLRKHQSQPGYSY
jgi:hypothetical protein